jgi:autotransporter-associated beta strand protein
LGGANVIAGVINISGGHLRYDAGGAPGDGSGFNYTLANGTQLSTPFFIGEAAVGAGATATINQTSPTNQFMRAIHGQGSGEHLVLNMAGTASTTHSLQGDWGANNGAFGSVVFNGTDETAAVNVRAMINNATSWNGASFTNTAVTLNNARFFVRTNSGGNTVTFGSLSGDSTGALAGGNAGTAVRYVIGGLNTDTEFGGILDGAGGFSINKVGTGTLTLSGGVSETSPVLSQALAGRQGGVIRVSEGTLATSGTFDRFAGGQTTFNTTVDVRAGAVLDVSGSTNTFSSQPLQQFIGSGTIRGAFNHAAGTINPADVSIADGGHDLTNVLTPTVGTLEFDGTLSFNGGTIVYDMNATPGSDDLISVTGLTNLGSGGMVQPNFLGAAPIPGLTYTLLSSAGGFTGNTSGWSVSWPGRGAKPSVVTNGNLLQFTTTAVGAGGDIVWSGSVNGNWDIETTQNWRLGGSPDVYFEGDNVTFNNSGTTTDVNVTTSVAPGGMVIDSTTNNYTFSGNAIVGAGGLTKRGSSTLTMGMTNGFTGPVVVEQGQVVVGANTALGTGPLTMSGASLTSAGPTLGNSSLTATAGTVNSIQVDGSAGAGGTWGIPNLAGGGDLTINSAVDDKWFAINATGDFSGTLTVAPNNGALRLGNLRAAAGQTTFPNAVVNLSGVTFSNRQASGVPEIDIAFGELQGDADTVLNGFVGGSTTLPAINWVIGNLNTDSNFAGTIVDGAGGSGSVAVSHLTKVGSGSLTLTGANTYTGDTTVEGGLLSINSPFLNDFADLFVMNGAQLELSFAGTDIIDGAIVHGMSLEPGIYGALGSGAANEIAGLLGTGFLQVTTLLEVPVDTNGDGFVDGLDFLQLQRENIGLIPAWEAAFGTVPGAGALAAGVPEPTSALLALAGVLAAMKAGRRARR